PPPSPEVAASRFPSGLKLRNRTFANWEVATTSPLSRSQTLTPVPKLTASRFTSGLNAHWAPPPVPIARLLTSAPASMSQILTSAGISDPLRSTAPRRLPSALTAIDIDAGSFGVHVSTAVGDLRSASLPVLTSHTLGPSGNRLPTSCCPSALIAVGKT